MKGSKFVRFEDPGSQKSYNSETRYSTDVRFYTNQARLKASAIWDGVRGSWETGFERLRGMKKPLSAKAIQSTAGGGGGLGARKNILDPQDRFLQKWNKIFVFVCFFAVSLDPLFLYIPVVDGKRKCLMLDTRMETTACVLRTLIDIFYLLRIMFQFRTGFIAPSSRVFGRGELVDDPKAIAKRYLRSYFLIDLLAVLPLPQVVVLIVLPKLKGPVALVAKNILKYVILSQYVPRLIRIYPLFNEVTRTSGILTETAWLGAAFNLFLYMLASHVIGSFWYLFAIEQQDKCWRRACKKNNWDSDDLLYCRNGTDVKGPNQFLTDACPFIDPEDINNSTVFNFGIYNDALKSEIVESTDFPKKLFYCFWWGLRNLSSLGQGLETSTAVPENLFAVAISVAGLVLFSFLIGNMQKYLQSTTVRIEEMRVKRRDADQWMSHRMLPEDLRERIRKYEQYKWQETRGVEERTLIRSLPKDLRRDINRHLCLDLLIKVPMFEKMDEQILDAVCDRLRPALYTKDSYIVREGDPVDEMLFIIRGDLVSMTTNGGRTGFFNAADLKAGDFCGEGLLTWALDPQSSSTLSLPISTRTVQARTEVEALALVAEDLKAVASQFRRLHHKDIQHTFRYCSVQWKTWAACFIQAAWRRYYRRKQAKILRQSEESLQDVLANEASGTSPSLGATLYASRFAANALRNLRQNGGAVRTSPTVPAPTPRLPPQRLPLVPQKPAEPDFSARH